MAPASIHRLNILRGILREIKRTNKNIQSYPFYKFILSQYRFFGVTSEQYCKAEKELEFTAETYFSYLQSSRCHRELIDKYKTTEKTTEQAANIVGLQLPKSPDST